MSARLRLVTEPVPGSTIREFMDAMSALASGVTIVTCRHEGRPWGVTVSAFASVSIDPPTVLVSLAADGTAARAIERTQRYGVSILAEDQLGAACYGSVSGEPKYLESVVEPGVESYAIAGALAHLECEVCDEIRVADHTVFFGRVLSARSMRDGRPLLHHRRDYRALATYRPTERGTTWVAN
jgi:flavin reductase (DIM6/NTAB) family NADH-FMN oxidoreductase RutF